MPCHRAKSAGAAVGASHSGHRLEFLSWQPRRQMLQANGQLRINLPRFKRLHFWGKYIRRASFPKVSIKSFQDCWFWGNLDGMPLASVVLALERFHQTRNQLGNICERNKYLGFHELSFGICMYKKIPFA